MIATDEDALICDLAEYYHIIDYQSISLNLLATLAYGLREHSRSRMLLSGMHDLPENLLLTKISDELTAIRYGLTAKRDDERPTMMSSLIFEKREPKKETKSYESGDDFRAEWQRRIRGK